MFSSTIGASVLGRNITALFNFDFEKGIPPGSSLLIGGIHGDEPATVFLLESFWRKYLSLLGSPVAILPLANPDGFNRNSRYNARGVDINRNFGFNWHPESEEPPGKEPWSEPETCALRDFILKLRPTRVVSLHWALAEIDADGPQSTELATAMWEALNEEERKPYRLRVSGQQMETLYEICPGSLGQWCGYGLQEIARPAIVTLELPYNPHAEERPVPIPANHLAELKQHWKNDPRSYLLAVEDPVHRMLLAACGESD